MRSLDATLRGPADDLRALDLERLDRLWRPNYLRALSGNYQATLACLRIMERRARLLGLDAPVRTEGKLAHESTGGVLVVPMPMTRDDWQAVASKSQAELIERERSVWIGEPRRGGG
jgi:hypothetical protein